MTGDGGGIVVLILHYHFPASINERCARREARGGISGGMAGDKRVRAFAAQHAGAKS